MTHNLAHRLRRPATLLSASEPVASAARKLLDDRLRALPVVDERDRFVGVFGEREFLRALFPRYVGELRSAAFITPELDQTIEHLAVSSQEPIMAFVTTDHVEVGPDASDLHVAETFMNHRVLILPVIEHGAVIGVIDRQEFVAELARAFLGSVESG